MTTILYSYRRCPYAIRARIALRAADIKVEIREISLRDKPPEMLEISPKGTVPVLHCSDGLVLDQSLDIMYWALRQHDPESWLREGDPSGMQDWIHHNDTQFKHWLDRYKYAERYPECTKEQYRDHAVASQIVQMEGVLLTDAFLGGARPLLADVALFPFVRQFAAVDPVWFDASPYQATRRWLNYWVESDLFRRVMEKSPKPSDSGCVS